MDSEHRVEIFFDYSSPFAYLGSTQIEAIAEATEAKVVWRPFLLGALFKEIGTPIVPMATFPQAKADHARKDMERWAEWYEVPLHFPSNFPIHTVMALRLTLATPVERRPALIHRIMRLVWVEDALPDEAGLLRCLEDVGLDTSLLDQVGNDDIKQALRGATDGALARGVPGAPTFFVGEELFWGQDRLLFVEAALRSRT